MKKQIILFLFLLLSAATNAQDNITGGVYWTYEDYKNGKLDPKGKLTGIFTTIGNITAIFTNEVGEKVKVNVNKCLAFKSEIGSLWRIHKNAGALRAIIKGDACLYVEGFLGEIECTKKGYPKLGMNVFYVSKGIDGELVYGPKKVKAIVADDPAALEEVSKNPTSIVNAQDAYRIYNKNHPQPGDYIIPDCRE